MTGEPQPTILSTHSLPAPCHISPALVAEAPPAVTISEAASNPELFTATPPTLVATTVENDVYKFYLTELEKKKNAELEEKSLKRKLEELTKKIETEKENLVAAQNDINVSEGVIQQVMENLTGRQGYELHGLVTEHNAKKQRLSFQPEPSQSAGR
jgi:biopolymer transport protein ExbD